MMAYYETTTANDYVAIRITLPSGTYWSAQYNNRTFYSMTIKEPYESGTTRVIVDATLVTEPSTNSDGYVEFQNVLLPYVGLYSFTVNRQLDASLEYSPYITNIGSGTITKFTNNTTIIV